MNGSPRPAPLVSFVQFAGFVAGLRVGLFPCRLLDSHAGVFSQALDTVAGHFAAHLGDCGFGCGLDLGCRPRFFKNTRLAKVAAVFWDCTLQLFRRRGAQRHRRIGGVPLAGFDSRAVTTCWRTQRYFRDIVILIMFVLVIFPAKEAAQVSPAASAASASHSQRWVVYGPCFSSSGIRPACRHLVRRHPRPRKSLLARIVPGRSLATGRDGVGVVIFDETDFESCFWPRQGARP